MGAQSDGKPVSTFPDRAPTRRREKGKRVARLICDSFLMMAARLGDVAIAKALLDRGAPVDGRDATFQQTPLMLAVRSGSPALVRLLIEHRADPNAQTRTGATPAFRLPASNAGSKGAGIVRGGWPERGERDPTPGAKTPLLYAARDGHADIAFGANDFDRNGVTVAMDQQVRAGERKSNEPIAIMPDRIGIPIGYFRPQHAPPTRRIYI